MKESRKSEFEISVFSLPDMLDEIYFPTDWNIVSIRDPSFGRDIAKIFKDCRKNYKSAVAVEFDDISAPVEGLRMASSAHLRRILKWSAGREKIAVHCTAGISRSSAVAYLIACSRMPVKKALGVLDPEVHNPNRHILRLGAAILGDEAIYNECMEWIREQDRLIDKWLEAEKRKQKKK